MRGIGERLDPVAGLPELALLLVNPRRPIATAAVFAALGRPGRAAPDDGAPFEAPSDDAPSAEAPAPREHARLIGWLRARGNDLQGPAARLEPAIGVALDELAAQPGCLLTRMSGSGATCFGIYRAGDQVRAAAAALRRTHPEWWLAATRTEGS